MQGRAIELLGRFNDDLTRVFDDASGTRWAEIEEILAISSVAYHRSVSTRRLAEVTRLNRRAISRMVIRLRSLGLVLTRASDGDRRIVDVILTDRGERLAEVLRGSMVEFFRGSTEIALKISEALGPVAEKDVAGSADVMDLLQRVCEAGVSLVRSMPDAATQGQLAARQRAALVQIATPGGTRPHDLAISLGVTRGGVVYIVDQLCAKGFVVRRRGSVPEDRRAVLLEATAEGVDAVRAVMRGIEDQREPLAALFAEIARWHPPGAAVDLAGASAGGDRDRPGEA